MRVVRKGFERTSVGLACPPEEGRAKQAMRDECDVNVIVRKWLRTGQNPHVTAAQGAYGDFSNVDDYQAAVEGVQASRAAFMELPSEIRKEFDNSPSALLAFLDDPSNTARAIELGLVEDPEAVVIEPPPELAQPAEPEPEA